MRCYRKLIKQVVLIAMETVVLKTFDNYFFANIILTRLQADGVACFLKDEHTVTIDPLLSNAVGGIKLAVALHDGTRAAMLLAVYEEGYLKETECPQCSALAMQKQNRPGSKDLHFFITKLLVKDYTVPTEVMYTCTQCGFESKTIPGLNF